MTAQESSSTRCCLRLTSQVGELPEPLHVSSLVFESNEPPDRNSVVDEKARFAVSVSHIVEVSRDLVASFQPEYKAAVALGAGIWRLLDDLLLSWMMDSDPHLPEVVQGALKRLGEIFMYSGTSSCRSS